MQEKQLVLFHKENERLSLCTSTFLVSHISLCLTYLIKSVHLLKPTTGAEELAKCTLCKREDQPPGSMEKGRCGHMHL